MTCPSNQHLRAPESNVVRAEILRVHASVVGKEPAVRHRRGQQRLRRRPRVLREQGAEVREACGAVVCRQPVRGLEVAVVDAVPSRGGLEDEDEGAVVGGEDEGAGRVGRIGYAPLYEAVVYELVFPEGGAVGIPVASACAVVPVFVLWEVLAYFHSQGTRG